MTLPTTLCEIVDHQLPYLTTVYVEGNLQAYIEDMEAYFRDSLKSKEETRDVMNTGLEKLAADEKCSQEEHDLNYWDIFGDSYERYGVHFEVDATNIQQVRGWMTMKRDNAAGLARAQKINHSRLLDIMHGSSPLTALNLTNYAYENQILRAEYAFLPPGSTAVDAIRIRIFSHGMLRRHRPEGFVDWAIQLPNVMARIWTEDDVHEHLPTLDDFVAGGGVRRSRLVVHQPKYEIEQQEAALKYSIFLGEAEIEMLKMVSNSLCDLGSISYGSATWSPYQGDKIMKNLFGIIAVCEEPVGRYNRNKYSFIYVPSQNLDAITEAIQNSGAFSKTIGMEDLAVLRAIYDRTDELRSKYGNDFYPRFSPTELSNRTGLDKKEVESSLQNLTGILVEAFQPYTFVSGTFITEDYHSYKTNIPKWFIPKARMELAEQALQLMENN